MPSAAKSAYGVVPPRPIAPNHRLPPLSSADPDSAPPSRAFAVTLRLIALITPLAVHLFFPVIPAVKVALGLS
ncbi:hypothetical protein, partial [Vibrio parahaemolyticus]|uniref:hypothetical protein n=1 Tax=Vibrio parahaemolyticus TaxID=670 RepID=UPI001A8FC6A8